MKSFSFLPLFLMLLGAGEVHALVPSSMRESCLHVLTRQSYFEQVPVRLSTLREGILSDEDLSSAYQKLEAVRRQGWLNRGVESDVTETVLEHSEKVFLAAVYYANRSWKVSQKKLATMMFVHDLAEYEVPDYTPFDSIARAVKVKEELDAIYAITQSRRQIPRLVRSLFEEYQAKESWESRIGTQLDKIDPSVQAMYYERDGYQVSDFYSYTRSKLSDPHLIKVFDELLTYRNQDVDYYQIYFKLLDRSR